MADKIATPGIGVDAHGGPVIDPTANVISLVVSESRRQDDLRMKDREISDIQHRHQTEMASQRALHESTVGRLREEYQEKIAHAESGRLDSIRQVDREEVAKTAVAANTAITTLAKQTTDLQQTLAKQVTDTAAAQETRNAAQYGDVTKRLQAVELALSEGKGKQTVVDPQMDKLTLLVETLARQQSSGEGKEKGINTSWVVLGGVVTLIATLVGLAAVGVTLVVFLNRTPASQQPIYVPAPAGTVLPATPPQTVPR